MICISGVKAFNSDADVTEEAMVWHPAPPPTPPLALPHDLGMEKAPSETQSLDGPRPFPIPCSLNET